MSVRLREAPGRARARRAAWTFAVAGAAYLTALGGCGLIAGVDSLTERRTEGAEQDGTTSDGGSIPDTTAPDADQADTASDAASDSGDAGTVVLGCPATGDGLTNCGAGAERCCSSLLVSGGTFSRSYNGMSTFSDGGPDPQYIATISDFRLDRYEITVGRFRKFVDAVGGGFTPPAGSGKHTHLNGGSGLAASGGGFESGWDVAWNTNLPTVKSTWDSTSFLACDLTRSTWTPTPGANERRPINCVTWYQAAAFCIWDGGFLPSEAEWNYAAAGGSEQRSYPWSSAYPPGSMAISNANAVYCGASCAGTQDVGAKAPAGDGRYGQADLAGNLYEYTLDWYTSPYAETSCVNCAYLSTSSGRVFRGGSFFDNNGQALLAGERAYQYSPPSNRWVYTGARCARAP
jgi:formylglycine-generating enzyme required for sulfatase activity